MALSYTRNGWTIIENQSITGNIVLTGVTNLVIRNVDIVGYIILTQCDEVVCENVKQYNPAPTTNFRIGFLFDTCRSVRVFNCEAENNYLDGFKTNRGYGKHQFIGCRSHGNGAGAPEGGGYDHYADGGEIMHVGCRSYDNNGSGLIFKTWNNPGLVATPSPATTGTYVTIIGYNSLRDNFGIGIEPISEIDYPTLPGGNPGWPRDICSDITLSGCTVAEPVYWGAMINSPRTSITGCVFDAAYGATQIAGSTDNALILDWHFDGDISGCVMTGNTRVRGVQRANFSGGSTSGDLRLDSVVGYQIQEITAMGFKVGGTIIRTGASPVREDGYYF